MTQIDLQNTPEEQAAIYHELAKRENVSSVADFTRTRPSLPDPLVRVVSIGLQVGERVFICDIPVSRSVIEDTDNADSLADWLYEQALETLEGCAE